MKVINSNEVNVFNINGFVISAASFKEALAYVWAINNPIKVVVRFDDKKELTMQVEVGYQSQWFEDSIAIAIEDRLELIGMSYACYEVYSMDGEWLSSSEL